MAVAAAPARQTRRDAPPRLVLRFAVCTGVGLAVAAAAILLVFRHYNTVQAERAATSQARVLAATVLRGTLGRSDFRAAVADARRVELDRVFAADVLDEGVLLAKVLGADGTVTYSTDHRLIGSKERLEHLREARAGAVRGDVTTLALRGTEPKRVLRTYAPVAIPGGIGVVVLFQDYAPIARAAEATFLPVAGIFEAVLVLLFLMLVPILRRVTVRIRRQMEEIEHRALYDELTALPNRTLFRERIEEALQRPVADGCAATVMFLDIDRFKEINDTLGHQTGDLLLQEIGTRLRGLFRDGETIARLGGDEFGVLLPSITSEQASERAAGVHAQLQTPFQLRGLPLEVATSIGIARYPEHGTDVDSLLQHADVAMYVAKDLHEGTAVYDPEQDTNDAARLALAGELRAAIENHELVLFFQPKAELGSGRIVGAEALVRWQHPDRGFIPPNDFIPIAERTGLIRPLTRYVLEAAVSQCAAWAGAGHVVHVAVNLTIPDLLDLELPDRLASLLADRRVAADQLELELTETTILADPFRVRQVLGRLNELGLRLAIDDFGTGYSSLAYLKRLPVQTIKVDRSFVMGMCEDASDATIVRSTIDLGRNLGLDVVAEGVESVEIWNALRDYGCTLAQGYLIGRPMPADELTVLLEDQTAPLAAVAHA